MNRCIVCDASLDHLTLQAREVRARRARPHRSMPRTLGAEQVHINTCLDRQEGPAPPTVARQQRSLSAGPPAPAAPEKAADSDDFAKPKQHGAGEAR
jgi:hypothetical protein